MPLVQQAGLFKLNNNQLQPLPQTQAKFNTTSPRVQLRARHFCFNALPHSQVLSGQLQDVTSDTGCSTSRTLVGWKRPRNEGSCLLSSYASFTRCCLTATTSMGRDPSPDFSRLSAPPFRELSEVLEQPTNSSAKHHFSFTFLGWDGVNREQSE